MYRFKNFLYVSAACLLSVLFGVGVKATNLSPLSALPGQRTYFLDAASSQSLMRSELTLAELDRVKGECVFLDLQSYEGGRYALNEELAQNILQTYDAEIVFTERVGEVVSYYAYTSRWQGGVFLQGARVNLHIALTSARCAVGTPVIFGGY